MSSFFEFDKIPLKEILNINDENIQKELAEYISFFKANGFDINYNYSLEDNLFFYELEKERSISSYFIPGHNLELYSLIEERKSRKRRLCSFCGNQIKIGDYYIRYNPLIIDRLTNKAYVLQNKIIVLESCRHILPSDIRELEELGQNIDNAYSCSWNPENYYPCNMGDHADFIEMGNSIGSIGIKQLTKKRVRKIP